MKTIPEIPFEKQTGGEMEFEIFTLESLFAREGRVRPLLRKPHRVEFYNILYIEKQAGVHYIDFRSVPFGEGALVFVSPGQVHAFEVVPERRGALILVTENFLSKNLIRSDLLSLRRLYDCHFQRPVVRPDETARADFAKLVGEMIREYESDETFAKEEMLRLLLKMLLLKAERLKKRSAAPEGNSGWFEKFAAFRRLVEKRFSETRNAKDYAAFLNMSYKRLNEISKAISGKTAKGFIDSYAVLEIKRRLATTELSIKELTYLSGFDEPTNFVKFFKKHTGQTPSQFRRSE